MREKQVSFESTSQELFKKSERQKRELETQQCALSTTTLAGSASVREDAECSCCKHQLEGRSGMGGKHTRTLGPHFTRQEKQKGFSSQSRELGEILARYKL